MALISQKNTTPPDGWRYIQAETKARMEHQTLSELVDMVVQHRRWAGLKPDDAASVQLDVERQICMAQFPGVCHPEPGEDYRPLKNISRSLTVELVEAMSTAAFEFLKSGMRWADEATANRRADICRGCPLNFSPHACSCAPVWAIVRALIPSDRRLPGLSICAICGCSLEAKVLMPESVIAKADEGRDLRYPGYCWAAAI
jgi:hypothetical protein